MNKQEAANYVNGLLAEENMHYRSSTVFIKSCVEYDFGWYFAYGVRGEGLLGGPDYGRFVSIDGFSYPVHYVGTPWDTGIGTHMDSQVDIINGIDHPKKHVVRYFLKKLKVIEAIRKNQAVLNKTFKTDNKYDYKAACKWLKLDLCMTRNKALDWISNDSGANMNYMDPGYDRAAFDTTTSYWYSLVNEGLLDSNWQSYYEKAIA